MVSEMCIRDRIEGMDEKLQPQLARSRLKRPDSFNACLQQVVNECQDAFMLAHTNMAAVELDCSTIPDNIKSGLKILFMVSILF